MKALIFTIIISNRLNTGSYCVLLTSTQCLQTNMKYVCFWTPSVALGRTMCFYNSFLFFFFFFWRSKIDSLEIKDENIRLYIWSRYSLPQDVLFRYLCMCSCQFSWDLFLISCLFKKYFSTVLCFEYELYSNMYSL